MIRSTYSPGAIGQCYAVLPNRPGLVHRIATELAMANRGYAITTWCKILGTEITSTWVVESHLDGTTCDACKLAFVAAKLVGEADAR